MANIEVLVFRVGTVCHCTAEFVGSVPNNLTTTGKIQNHQGLKELKFWDLSLAV